MKNSNDQHEYKYDIMISYSYADKDIVHKIQQFLANEGYIIWSERNDNNEQGNMRTLYSLSLEIRPRNLIAYSIV
jgi:hypothetical protein